LSSLDPKTGFPPALLRLALAAAVAFSLTLAPHRAIAQQPATAPSASTSSSAASASGAASAQEQQSEEDQEKAFLYSPVVQSIARILHLDVKTTSHIFLGINFAVIVLAIAIPLGRVMPRIFRKRSQSLSHDLKTAREATADASARLRAVEAKIAGLGQEMQRFRAQVEQDMVEDEKRMKAAIGEESARIVAAAEQEIGAAAAQARRALRNFAAELAIDHAGRQLSLTPETDRALIAEFVAGVAGDGAGKGVKS
jgi:F-type H+-transporting ATPase subunit b